MRTKRETLLSYFLAAVLAEKMLLFDVRDGMALAAGDQKYLKKKTWASPINGNTIQVQLKPLV